MSYKDKTSSFDPKQKQHFCIKENVLIKSLKVNFELQEEFEELTIDDRNLKTVFELTDEDTKLVQTQMNPKGIKAVITRTIVAKENGGQFIMMVDMVCNGVRSTAEFKKLN